MPYTSANTPHKSMPRIMLPLLCCVGYFCLSVIDLNAVPPARPALQPLTALCIAPPADTVYFILTQQIVGHATNCTAQPLEKDEGIAKTMYCRAIREDGRIAYRYAYPLGSQDTRSQMHEFLVHSDTLSIGGPQRSFFFDNELFILRYLTPQYPIRLDTSSVKQFSSSSARPPLTIAQKFKERITPTGHGEIDVSMTKDHDVWNFDSTHKEIVGCVYQHEGQIFAYKMNLTVERTEVTSVANYSTTYRIDFRQIEDQQLIEKLRLRF